MRHAVLRPCVRGIFHKVISGVISHSDEASSGRKSYPCPSRYSFPEQPQQGDLHSRQRNYPATGMSCPRREQGYMYPPSSYGESPCDESAGRTVSPDLACFPSSR